MWIGFNTRLRHDNRHNIEIVNNYTYLGINFSSNGNFKVCKSNLKDKLRRSFYAIRRYLDFSDIPSDTTNKLFKWLFQPILLYGSEVWGIYDKDDFTNWEKDVIEKTHILPCKQSLGINKQCPNVAARNELGRLSLKLTIDINMLKCWIHLQNLPVISQSSVYNFQGIWLRKISQAYHKRLKHYVMNIVHAPWF